MSSTANIVGTKNTANPSWDKIAIIVNRLINIYFNVGRFDFISIKMMLIKITASSESSLPITAEDIHL
jgi:pimeloyl-CoA synthetase